MSGFLSPHQIEAFIHHGFVCVENAFSTEVAEAALDILWHDLPVDRRDAKTWNEPVIRLGMYSQAPFLESVNTPKLHSIFDQLVGKNRWLPCQSVGTFPVRFPSDTLPSDTGKHVDASFSGENPLDYFQWRVNVKSKGRALLMLVLYSDVAETDAPTLIYKGSHMDVARLLSPEGDAGLSFLELADKLTQLPEREMATATGKAGTVYLCHPFLVHAAQAHTGKMPRFMAQPPLLLKEDLLINGFQAHYSPVEQSIRLALLDS